MSLLIMMRHGQSEWNKKNLFTGWVDVPLSPKGIDEAIQGGKEIAELPIDVMYTSTLIRAQMTGMLAMTEHHSGKVPVILHPGDERCTSFGDTDLIPVYEAWQLNERHYGELQGMNKDEMRKKYSPEQVQIWRRSFDTPPPNGEALKDTAERTLPYFRDTIVPELAAGKNVFIAAHGNSLRSIVMELDGLGPDEVVKLEIGTGVPLIYEYTDGSFVSR